MTLNAIANASLIQASLVPFSLFLFELLLSDQKLWFFPPKQVMVNLLKQVLDNFSTTINLVIRRNAILHRHKDPAQLLRDGK
jgi:hypothetical protein